MSEYTIEKIKIEEYHKCNNIWDMKKCPQQFKKQIIKGDRMVFICKKDDEFIAEGSLVINLDDSDYFIPSQRIYISRMIVKREYRNGGICQTMLEFLMSRAEKMGYTEVSIGVDADNKIALHIYKKAGFEIFKACEDKDGEYYKMIKRLY